MTTQSPIIKRALISVSNKQGIVELAQALHDLQIIIISTGGTAKLLQQRQIPVIEISDYTGHPEIMDGRVKTLHPKVHAGILARRQQDLDLLAELNIPTIDLVVVNLYPFQQVTSNPQCSLATAIENIDIGGPTLLRASAKNHQDVTVIVDPQDYEDILSELRQQQGTTTLATRFKLAQKAFAHTALYDSAIANYLQQTTIPEITAPVEDVISPSPFPEFFIQTIHKQQDLRYGENPHQRAAFYVESPAAPNSISTAQQLQGKALSFNNIVDADTAYECVKNFRDESPACVIVKHANPCGVAIANNLHAAYQRAYASDATSAFGGIIALNQEVDAQTANQIINQQFAEVIIAPKFCEEALHIFANKPNIRILSGGISPIVSTANQYDLKRITGGLLIQDNDTKQVQAQDIQVVTERTPTSQEIADLLFAWKVVKFVKSNAIVYAKDQATIGIGAGQMSRVYSTRIAGLKAAEAGLPVAGAVMASDAFFPFRDSIDAAAEAGITAIIQPGGSLRDQETIQAANEANIAMVFTGIRHFRH